MKLKAVEAYVCTQGFRREFMPQGFSLPDIQGLHATQAPPLQTGVLGPGGLSKQQNRRNPGLLLVLMGMWDRKTPRGSLPYAPHRRRRRPLFFSSSCPDQKIPMQ